MSVMTTGGNDRNANVVLTADIAQYQQATAQAAQNTNQLNQAVSNLTSSLSRLVHTASRRMELLGTGGVAGLAGATVAAARFEKQLTTLQAQTAVTGQNFKTLKGTVEDISRTFPVSAQAAAQLVTQITKLGVQGEQQIDKFSKTMVKLSGATGENVSSLTQQFAELNKSMGTLSAGSIDRYASALVKLSTSSGVSASNILSFTQALSPLASVAGISETKLLGISTAFTKVGADSGAAANTFATMLSDITNLIQSGSPELTKYSNLIGVTAAQFKQMDQATAIADIFDAINAKGPKAITLLNQLGYDGIRAQRAISAVVSGGGLQSSINTALTGYNQNTALNTGATAAFSGLSNSVDQFHEKMSGLAREMGTTFLTPLTAFVNILNSMLSVLEKIPAPIIGIGTALAGLGALGLLGGGGVLGHLGMLGGIASAFGAATSRPVQAIRGGLAYGRRGDLNTYAAEHYTAGTMGPISERLFLAAAAAGQGMGPGGGGRTNLLKAAALLPVRGASWFMEQSAHQYQQFGVADSFKRQSPFSSFFGGLFGGIGSAVRLKPEESIDRLQKAFKGMNEEANKSAVRIDSVHGQLARLLKAGGSMATQATLTAGRAGIAVGGGLLRAGASGLSSLLGGPIGLSLAGLTAGSLAYGAIQSHNRAADNPEQSFYNPLLKYNEMLGIVTQSTSNFSGALDKASSSLPKPTSTAQALNLSSTAIGIATSPGRNLTSPIVGQYLGNPKAAASFLRTLDVQAGGKMSPEQLQAVGMDFVQAGGIDYWNQVSQAYSAGPSGTNDIASQVKNAQHYQSGGLNFLHSGKTGALLAGTVGGIQASRTNALKYGTKYSKQITGPQVQELLYQLWVTGDARTMSSGLQELKNAKLVPDSFDFSKMPNTLMGIPEIDRATVGSYLSKSGYSGVTFGNGANAAAGRARYVGAATPTQVAIANTKVGRIATGSQQAGGPISTFLNNQASPVAQEAAANQLISSMQRQGASITDTINGLSDFKNAVNDATDPLSKMADYATQLVMTQLQVNQPYQSRSTNLAQSSALYQNALGDTSDNGPANRAATKAGYDAQREQVAGYYKSVIQAYRDYVVQDRYARQDYQKQVFRSNRDFNIQRTESQYEFDKSQIRARRDFNHQILLMTKDLASAQYNVYTRVQTSQSWDAANLLQNANRQTAMIRDQVTNLAKLRKMGISQNVIDVLGLSDPNNAQQLARFIADLAKDPKLVEQWNKSIKNRLDWSKGLATNKSSTQYREMKYQFDKAASDARKDFDHSMTMATEAFKRSLSDMAIDFATSEKRSMDQLRRMSQEIYGSFEQLETTALKLLGTNSSHAADVVIQNYLRARTTIANGGGSGGGGGGGAPGAGAGASAGKSGGAAGFKWTGGGSSTKAPVVSVDPTTRSQVPAVQANAMNKQAQERDKMLRTAYAELGIAYHWGGDDPKTGFDCSGLVYFAEHAAGIGIGRTTAAGYQRMSRKTSSPVPGDLVFYGSPAHHVGIYVGNGQMIDAPHTGAQVRVEGTGRGVTNYGVLPGLAKGGIAFKPSVMGEAGPEAAIPLNSAGAMFLAQFMMATMEQVKMSTVGSIPVSSYGHSNYSNRVNASTTYTGDITVQAQDPSQFAYKLAQRKRLQALNRPVQGAPR